MRVRSLLVVSGCSIGLLLLLVFITNPSESGPLGILGVYLLAYVSLSMMVTFLIYYGTRLARFMTHLFVRHRYIRTVSLSRACYYAAVLAMLPMMAVGLHAAGSLNWYSVLLLGTFGLLGVFYVAKRL